MSYKLCKGGSEGGNAVVTDKILRKSDNAIIPFNEANTDYQEYKLWLADGNTPEAADKWKYPP